MLECFDVEDLPTLGFGPISKSFKLGFFQEDLEGLAKNMKLFEGKGMNNVLIVWPLDAESAKRIKSKLRLYELTEHTIDSLDRLEILFRKTPNVQLPSKFQEYSNSLERSFAAKLRIITEDVNVLKIKRKDDEETISNLNENIKTVASVLSRSLTASDSMFPANLLFAELLEVGLRSWHPDFADPLPNGRAPLGSGQIMSYCDNNPDVKAVVYENIENSKLGISGALYFSAMTSLDKVRAAPAHSIQHYSSTDAIRSILEISDGAEQDVCISVFRARFGLDFENAKKAAQKELELIGGDV